jgi:hypothetical protein
VIKSGVGRKNNSESEPFCGHKLRMSIFSEIIQAEQRIRNLPKNVSPAKAETLKAFHVPIEYYGGEIPKGNPAANRIAAGFPKALEIGLFKYFDCYTQRKCYNDPQGS